MVLEYAIQHLSLIGDGDGHLCHLAESKHLQGAFKGTLKVNKFLDQHASP
jgi:hypothetical protein